MYIEHNIDEIGDILKDRQYIFHGNNGEYIYICYTSLYSTHSWYYKIGKALVRVDNRGIINALENLYDDEHSNGSYKIQPEYDAGAEKILRHYASVKEYLNYTEITPKSSDKNKVANFVKECLTKKQLEFLDTDYHGDELYLYLRKNKIFPYFEEPIYYDYGRDYLYHYKISDTEGFCILSQDSDYSQSHSEKWNGNYVHKILFPEQHKRNHK